jgi:hypothetical protein
MWHRMKKSKSKAGMKNNRSFVGTLKKSFSQAYAPMDDEIDRDPLVSATSSRYFSEEDLLEVITSQTNYHHRPHPPPPF